MKIVSTKKEKKKKAVFYCVKTSPYAGSVIAEAKESSRKIIYRVEYKKRKSVFMDNALIERASKEMIKHLEANGYAYTGVSNIMEKIEG